MVYVVKATETYTVFRLQVKTCACYCSKKKKKNEWAQIKAMTAQLRWSSVNDGGSVSGRKGRGATRPAWLKYRLELTKVCVRARHWIGVFFTRTRVLINEQSAHMWLIAHGARRTNNMLRTAWEKKDASCRATPYLVTANRNTLFMPNMHKKEQILNVTHETAVTWDRNPSRSLM
jgi:hypothetical protein